MNPYAIGSGLVFAGWVLDPRKYNDNVIDVKYAPLVALLGAVGIPLMDRVLPVCFVEEFHDQMLIGAVADLFECVIGKTKSKRFSSETEIITSSMKRVSTVAALSVAVVSIQKYVWK